MASAVKNRVKEFRMVSTAELSENPKNWRSHGYAQKKALSELLGQVGIAGALTAYHSKREGGKLTLIDGHMRAGDADVGAWPTLILDVTDDEADLLLATLDPMRGLASVDASKLEELLATSLPGSPALDDLLGQLLKATQASADDEAASAAGEEPTSGPPEMELQAFEHFDYVVFLFKSSLDWMHVQEKLELTRVKFTQRDGKSRKIGLGRVVDGAKLLELLK